MSLKYQKTVSVSAEKYAQFMAMTRERGLSASQLMNKFLAEAGAPSIPEAQRVHQPKRVIVTKKLADVLKAQRLSILRAATNAGVSSSSLWCWLSGVSQPSPQNLQALCESLGIEVDSITVMR